MQFLKLHLLENLINTVFWIKISLSEYFVQVFVAIPRAAQRWVAGIGVVVFTLYLVYDFNHLAKLQAAGVNDWRTAINIAIDVYLDIINLFLDLLDAVSK